MYAYLCVTCGGKCQSSHQYPQTERFIGIDKKATLIHGIGLGTWRCPVHGKVKVRRVKETKRQEALALCA